MPTVDVGLMRESDEEFAILRRTDRAINNVVSEVLYVWHSYALSRREIGLPDYQA